MPGLKFVLNAVVVLLLVYISSFAFDLMNYPDDFAVAGGIAILVVEFLVAMYMIKKNPFSAISRKGASGKKKPTNKTAAIMLIVGIVGANTACYQVVEPGHAGIKINMAGSDRGVSDITVQTGRVWYNPVNTRVFEYPTFVQTAVWKRDSELNEEISFNSKEGITFTADLSLSWQIQTDKVPNFYVMFRNDDVTAFTHGFLRNIARDAFTEIAPSYTSEEIYSTKMGELVTRVKARTDSLIVAYGVHLQQFGFIGAPRPPENIVKSLNLKTQAIQDASAAENKLRQTTAEARMAVAKAQGEAEANRALASSLTTSMLEWRRLEITEQSIKKWDGKLPVYSGGTLPLIQLPTPNR